MLARAITIVLGGGSVIIGMACSTLGAHVYRACLPARRGLTAVATDVGTGAVVRIERCSAARLGVIRGLEKDDGNAVQVIGICRTAARAKVAGVADNVRAQCRVLRVRAGGIRKRSPVRGQLVTADTHERILRKGEAVTGCA